ncbi:transporter [Geobacter hydrogenophilus]|nr:transporter [Geobacter hydrogenophilus]
MRRVTCAVAFGVLLATGGAFGEEAKKIQDNSFLLEEAYNQEDGVVQHIQAFQYMKGDTWAYTFTQEWPVPKQAHQLSYTIPVLKNASPGRESGLGDVLLNYRYQAVMKEGIALAPRFSFVLPTGDYKRGLGNGTVGYQVNMPLSVELSDKVVTHWNMGLTFTPNAKEAGGAKADTVSLNYGASVIYLLTENFNLMLEAVGGSSERVEADGSTTHEDSFLINPGFRYAFNFKSGLQIVPGISFPIGIGPSRGDYGVLTYLSFEHPLF